MSIQASITRPIKLEAFLQAWSFQERYSNQCLLASQCHAVCKPTKPFLPIDNSVMRSASYQYHADC